MSIANSLVENAWYAVGLSDEFAPDQVLGRVIASKPLVLWRNRDGQVSVFDDRCVHKRMPLSAGRIMDDGCLECVYHGLRYDAGGVCVAIPSQPDSPIPTRARLRPYPLHEQQGVVWVWPGDDGRIGDSRPPATPEIDAADWDTVSSGCLSVAANYRLLIENLLDITHF